VSYFNQQEEPSSEASDKVAELASTLQSSLPSTPIQAPDSPMQRTQQLPSISLSGELASPETVKKQYSSSYFSPSASSLRLPVLPSLSLPPLSRSAPVITKQPEIVSVPSPESDPCASPPLSSPKQRSKKNYTKEFNLRFHDLLNNNELASNEWYIPLSFFVRLFPFSVIQNTNKSLGTSMLNVTRASVPSNELPASKYQEAFVHPLPASSRI
jgi:hypothetical protein